MHIRPCVEADLPAVIACFEQSVQDIASRYYSPQEVAAWIRAADRPDAWRARLEHGSMLIAQPSSESAVAGFVRVEANGWINLLYVHPRFERRGIGRALLDEACGWATAAGAATAAADVSLAAEKLFAAAGFRLDHARAVERGGITLRNLRMTRALR